MVSEIIEPQGSSGPPPSLPHAVPEPRAPGRPGGGTPVPSTSGDDLTASLTHVRPDPLLGEFAPRTESPPAEDDSPLAHLADARRPSEEAPDLGVVIDRTEPRADVMEALASLDRNDAPAAGSAAPVHSSDALAGLDLGIPAPAATQSERPRPPQSTTARGVESRRDHEDEDEEPEPRGVSWTVLLLASYASAVTLGLVWVLWSGRKVREDVPDVSPTADARPDPGRRADRSHRVEPPKPIPAEQTTTLKQAVRIGQIEVTPLDITSGTVVLERNFNGRETRRGGSRALKLRLRLKNVSTDTVLAPFDEAFVRERVGEVPDSYVETGDGGPVIALFPLAVESELSIVGQSFRELRPGEDFETVVVTVPDALVKMTSEMTWRVRLRTDVNHTDDLGVRFRPEDVKPGR